MAIVTGGLTGIGAAIVEQFAAEGAVVIAADISAPATPLDASQSITALHLDVADPASVVAAVDVAYRLRGRIDYLVHAADGERDIRFLDTSIAEPAR